MQQENDYLKEYFQLRNQNKKKSIMITQRDHTCTNKQFLDYLKILEKQTKNNNLQNIIDQHQYKQLVETLQRGRNVCVYGRGSKINLINKIVKNTFKKSYIFAIKGYHSNLNQKIIINNFGNFLKAIKIIDQIDKIRMTDQVKEYRKALQRAQSNYHIVVVFHNVDGVNILNYQAQMILSQLFRSQKIQLIASLDNIKIVMNWSPDTIANYKFNFFHLTTQQPYIDQLKYSVQKLRKKDKHQQALKYIWASLNKNQKDILKVMAKKQIKNIIDGIQQYYSFQELYEICVSEIILSSQYQLRQNLVQLLDHKVVQQKTYQQKNKRVYTIKFQRRILQQIVQDKFE